MDSEDSTESEDSLKEHWGSAQIYALLDKKGIHIVSDGMDLPNLDTIRQAQVHDYPYEDRLADNRLRDLLEEFGPQPEDKTVDILQHLVFYHPVVLDDKLFIGCNNSWASVLGIYNGHRPKPVLTGGFTDAALGSDSEALFKLIMAFQPSPPPNVMFPRPCVFPFVCIEANRTSAGLAGAHQRHGFSARAAIRGVMWLATMAGCEDEFIRQPVFWSWAYDSSTIDIGAHYARGAGPNRSYHRCGVAKLDMGVAADVRRWYGMSRHIFEVWAPTHLKRLQQLIQKAAARQ